MLHVFGYGSLTFSPELPDSLVTLRRARLVGWRRAFNKRSRSRSIPEASGFSGTGPVPPEFRRRGRRWSLTLGTVADPNGWIDGLVATYPASEATRLLPLLDRREGFDPAGPGDLNGYVPTEVTVEVDDGRIPARAYLTNPAESCPWTLRPAPDPASAAALLIHATPRRRPPAGHPRAPGLDYLEGTRTSLHAIGVVDPHLEAVARAVRAEVGPWLERVAPPRDALPSER